VSGAGELLDLHIEPAAMDLRPDDLGQAIVTAAWYASADARQRAYTLLALALGDEAAAEVERLDGPVPARMMGWDTVSTQPSPEATGDTSIFRPDR
jgi:hypothetical protein